MLIFERVFEFVPVCVFVGSLGCGKDKVDDVSDGSRAANSVSSPVSGTKSDSRCDFECNSESCCPLLGCDNEIGTNCGVKLIRVCL